MTQSNPFEGSEYNMVQFVQLSRIYDVLMAILTDQNPTAARMVMEAHARGDLVSPSPDYSGEFIFDQQNMENTKYQSPPNQ